LKKIETVFSVDLSETSIRDIDESILAKKEFFTKMKFEVRRLPLKQKFSIGLMKGFSTLLVGGRKTNKNNKKYRKKTVRLSLSARH